MNWTITLVTLAVIRHSILCDSVSTSDDTPSGVSTSDNLTWQKTSKSTSAVTNNVQRKIRDFVWTEMLVWKRICWYTMIFPSFGIPIKSVTSNQITTKKYPLTNSQLWKGMHHVPTFPWDTHRRNVSTVLEEDKKNQARI